MLSHGPDVLGSQLEIGMLFVPLSNAKLGLVQLEPTTKPIAIKTNSSPVYSFSIVLLCKSGNRFE